MNPKKPTTVAGKNTLAERLKKAGKGIAEVHKPTVKPVWEGPLLDGITYSLLSRFLNCRERFRLLVVEGLRTHEEFNHRIEYGNMWHVCEEAFAKGGSYVGQPPWLVKLLDYVHDLTVNYPLQQEQIVKWYNVCRAQFPIYCEYWQHHEDTIKRVPISQEEVFDCPYTIHRIESIKGPEVYAQGLVFRLRGKFDSVDSIDGKIWLQENKTKSEIDDLALQRQLSFDLQSMLYLTVLAKRYGWEKIGGVRYNVVRRPLSGGKGTIVRHKATKNQQEETEEHYYERLKIIISDSPTEFFSRWSVPISQEEGRVFEETCLQPLLMELYHWWMWIKYATKKGLPLCSSGIHWRHPFGVPNWLNEGGSSDVDEYLRTGSRAGLTKVDTLFKELE